MKMDYFVGMGQERRVRKDRTGKIGQERKDR